MPLKSCRFVGSSRKDLKKFPEDVQGAVGHALHEVQVGLEPLSAKALQGFTGRSVLEIAADHDGDTYRAVYTVRFADLVYVLHCFQKKSKTGIATPKHQIDIVKPACGQRKPTIKQRSNRESTMSTDEVFEGSGNVFADLGLPDAEDMLLKSSIVIEIRRLIEARNLTQTAAAKLLGIGQANLSKLLRGQFRGYSVDRLMRMLTAFSQDVEIITRPHPTAGKAGRISFRPA